MIILFNLGKHEESVKLFDEKQSIFGDKEKKDFISLIINLKGNISKKGPQIDEFNIYEEALIKYPFAAAYITHKIAGAYDGIFNDQESYLKFAKRAYELDSIDIEIINEYHTALIESGGFDIAKKLRSSKIYKLKKNKRSFWNIQQYAYYLQGDYQKSINLLVDSLQLKNKSNLAYIYAQLGNRKKLNPILKELNSDHNKAIVYAILKKKDSFFYYLNDGEITPFTARFLNSRPEIDTYRKDIRYIAFLKKYRFPVEGQKN